MYITGLQWSPTFPRYLEEISIFYFFLHWMYATWYSHTTDCWAMCFFWLVPQKVLKFPQKRVKVLMRYLWWRYVFNLLEQNKSISIYIFLYTCVRSPRGHPTVPHWIIHALLQTSRRWLTMMICFFVFLHLWIIQALLQADDEQNIICENKFYSLGLVCFEVLYCMEISQNVNLKDNYYKFAKLPWYHNFGHFWRQPWCQLWSH